MQQQILILDFGSQYTQLIARRLRELNVYCEIHPYNKIPEITPNIMGVILSGSPHSVREENPLKPNLDAIKGKLPLLGVCYGAQYLAHFYGGEVGKSNSREYGRANLDFVDNTNVLLKNVSQNSQVWMSHADTILSIPENYKVIASTHDVKVAAYAIDNETTFANRAI
jgi:GMP synthase (glutamine-hydrolysing)